MARPYAAASATALALLLAGTSSPRLIAIPAGPSCPGSCRSAAMDQVRSFSSNPAKVSGTFSATLSGFQPTPAYSYQAVTTSSSTYALPNGTAVVVYNTGSNPITIKLGASSVSVVSGQADVVPAGGWMAFTVGSATDYAVVGNGGASTVVVSGGSGLPTGSGGGGGGGAGGTVAQGSPASPASAWPVSETVAGSVVSSSNPVPISFGSGVTLPGFGSPPTVNIGAAPTVSVTGTFWQSTQPVSLASLPALSAGSNVIGAVTQSAGPWSVTWSGQAVAVSSLPSLPAGPNTIGSVTQSGTWSTGRTWTLGSGTNSVALGGTLPAFASTPTVNLGALNGAALDTSVQGVKSALGSPFQAGGSIGNTSFGALVTQWGGTTLGAATGVGTAASGNVPTVNADILVGGSAAATGNPVPITYGSGVSLPSGSNTIGAVNQGTANATPWNDNIAQFGGSTVTLGQQTAANSIPVILPSATITTLTPPSTVTTTPKAGTWSSGGCAVGTGASTCVPSGTYNHATVSNPATSPYTIACAWGASSLAVTAITTPTGAGQVLTPGMSFTWGPATAGVPASTVLYCIGSQSSGNAYA